VKTKPLASLTTQSDRGAWNVLGWAGLLLVGALYVFDLLEPFSFSFAAPICIETTDYAGFGPLMNDEINRATVHDASATDVEEAAGPFGMDTEPVTDGALLDKWRRVEASIAQDLEVIAQCQAGKPCPLPAQKLIDLGLEGAGRSGRARVGVINRAANFAIRPVSDETQWGVSDHWSAPFETLQSGRGDCEDYAIVKYAALLTAGVPKDELKIVVLRQRLQSEDHAVVAVRVDNQWLILDNRTLTLVRDTDARRVTPEFVLDHHGVRRFVRNGWNFKAANATALPAI
jgi:predicted transglutaminase-like cysteine proteinase